MDNTNTDLLVTRVDNEGVATLSLNRPAQLNALSPNLFIELREHLEDIYAKDTIGCVILRGEGRSFSAGNDLNAIREGEKAPSRHFQAETLEFIENLPQPVIAAVQGHCYTGSLELVLACDLLIAAESARFCDTHGKWAMAPTWGMTQRLPRRIGVIRAKEMMFTGRVVKGPESVALGLANYCVADNELDDRAQSLAREIVGNSWHTLKADKSLINVGLNHHLQDGLEFEREKGPGPGPDMADRLANFGKK
jgi:enoyl-CoA hydratase/carnithine racemase